MRGGRNKFGPMYKRDRARKLQLIRQRQLAIQTIRGSLGDPNSYSTAVAPLMHIKQEIQIPQVSSLTSSPDSSPSPATVAAGLVTTQAGGSGSGAGQHQLIAPSSQPNIGTSGAGGGGGGGGAAAAVEAAAITCIISTLVWTADSGPPTQLPPARRSLTSASNPCSHTAVGCRATRPTPLSLLRHLVRW